MSNNRTTILILLLVILGAIAVKMNFFGGIEAPIGELVDTSSIDKIVAEVEAINFDTTVIQDRKFQSLKSIDTPLVSEPVGKKNPFSSF